VISATSATNTADEQRQHSRDVILLRPEDINATLEPNVCAAGIYSTRIPELSVGTIGKNRAVSGTGLGFAAQSDMKRILCLIPLLFFVVTPVAADRGNPQGQEHSQAGGRGWARGRGHVGQEQRVVVPVPEPSSLALFGVGALTVLIRRRRAGLQM
jgi:PEP-CTERM motif